ncbi:hypothetical protein [Streptomyces sp. NPDC021020]|uniref:hypothetical protein n=1 Tax=Streptomyces sp. NPDC021020 TaxID=3365109 RepID=UPI0037A55A99
MSAGAHRDCTAFPLAELRAAAAWPGPAGAADAPDDGTVVYLWHDDLSVVTDPLVPGAPVLLPAAEAAAAPAWQRHCRQVLHVVNPAQQPNGGRGR